MFWHLVTVIAGLLGVAQLPAEMLTGPAGLVALAAVAVAGLVTAAYWYSHAGRRAGPTSPTFARAAALREQTRHTAFLRQRDPAAPGRPRPRAPSASRTAA